MRLSEVFLLTLHFAQIAPSQPVHESSESSATPKLDTPTTVPSTDDENTATSSTVASIAEVQQMEPEKKHSNAGDSKQNPNGK